jgi:hypothetical protein
MLQIWEQYIVTKIYIPTFVLIYGKNNELRGKKKKKNPKKSFFKAEDIINIWCPYFSIICTNH